MTAKTLPVMLLVLIGFQCGECYAQWYADPIWAEDFERERWEGITPEFKRELYEATKDWNKEFAEKQALKDSMKPENMLKEINALRSEVADLKKKLIAQESKIKTKPATKPKRQKAIPQDKYEAWLEEHRKSMDIQIGGPS
jgi:hypothetical protein